MAQDTFHFLRWLMPIPETAPQPDWQPAMDVYRSRRGWLLKFDLAGVKPEDVNITLSGNVLTVRGVRRDCVHEEGFFHYRMEIAYSRFERQVQLPGPLTNATISTDYRDGMLYIRVIWEGAA
jgi:HSP20 family protein